MRTISIKQPWASLICLGIKDIENRTWKCPQKYIGERVFIHASGNEKDNTFSKLNSVQLEYLAKHWDNRLSIPKCAAIIGSVQIVGCVINHTSIWAEKIQMPFGNKCPECGREIADLKSDYQECPDCRRKLWRHSNYDAPIYNWLLANPILFSSPIPAKGKLSFWKFEGLKEVDIMCPECNNIEPAIEDYTTQPFATYMHTCSKCGFMISESDWNVI